MLAQTGVSLVKGKTYQLTMDVRARGISAGVVSVAISNTQNWTNCGLSGDVSVSDAWSTVHKVFKATQDVSGNTRFQIWFHEPGTLWVRSETDGVCGGAGRVYAAVAGRHFQEPAGQWVFRMRADGVVITGHADRVGESGSPAWHDRDGGGASGERYLRIPMGPDKSPRMYFDYYEPVARVELSPLAASLGWIRVQPGRPYTLSCQMLERFGNVGGAGNRRGGAGRAATGPAQGGATDDRVGRLQLHVPAAGADSFVTIGPKLTENRECPSMWMRCNWSRRRRRRSSLAIARWGLACGRWPMASFVLRVNRRSWRCA